VQILHPFTGSAQQYAEEIFTPDRLRPDQCPQCQARQPLIAHGFYSRTPVEAGFDGLHPRAPLFVPVLQAHGLAAAAVRFRDFTVSGSPPARWPAEWRRFTDEWLAVAELQAGGAGSGAAAAGWQTTVSRN
jgi:hypothetical protein